MDWEKVKDWTDKLVGPALIIILIVVILEIFFPDVAHHYHTPIMIADYFAIGVFVVDLGFKFQRATTWGGFLKNYWLEILAIMPVFVVFRMLEVLIITRSAEIGQEALHLATRSERLATAFGASEISRAERMRILFRGLSRSPRLAKAVDFYNN